MNTQPMTWEDLEQLAQWDGWEGRSWEEIRPSLLMTARLLAFGEGLSFEAIEGPIERCREAYERALSERRRILSGELQLTLLEEEETAAQEPAEYCDCGRLITQLSRQWRVGERTVVIRQKELPCTCSSEQVPVTTQSHPRRLYREPPVRSDPLLALYQQLLLHNRELLLQACRRAGMEDAVEALALVARGRNGLDAYRGGEIARSVSAAYPPVSSVMVVEAYHKGFMALYELATDLAKLPKLPRLPLVEESAPDERPSDQVSDQGKEKEENPS